MSRDGRLRRAAESVASFDLSAARERDLCNEAQLFDAWALALCTAALENGSIIALKQAKLRLAERFVDRRFVLERRHRGRSGSTRHLCVDFVFFNAFEHLAEAERALQPPVIEVTGVIQQAPPRARWDGLVFGTVDDEFE